MTLPTNAKLHPLAVRDLKSLDPGGAAALMETFGRRALDVHLPRETAPFPIGRKKKLDEIRVTVNGNEFRLLYAQPSASKALKQKRGKSKKGTSSSHLPISAEAEEAEPGVFIGLCAYLKKSTAAPRGVGETAWTRLQTWRLERAGQSGSLA